MKTLDRLGLTENTLIILSSDNGPVLDDGYDDKAVELAGSHKPGGPFRGGNTVPSKREHVFRPSYAIRHR